MQPLALYSLGTTFGVVVRFDAANVAEAGEIVHKHIAGSGYTNLRTVDDGDGSIRFIADPPKGRKGRNVASFDIY